MYLNMYVRHAVHVVFLYYLSGRSFIMEITTYTNFRRHLRSFLDLTVTSKAPIVITRDKGEDAIVMSKSEYDGLMETFYLLKSPENAKRLLSAIKELDSGNFVDRDLIEE